MKMSKNNLIIGSVVVVVAVVSVIAIAMALSGGGSSHMNEALEANQDQLEDVSEEYLREVVDSACEAFNETTNDQDETVIRAGVWAKVSQDVTGSAEAAIESLLDDDTVVVDAAMNVVRAGILDECPDYHWEPAAE